MKPLKLLGKRAVAKPPHSKRVVEDVEQAVVELAFKIPSYGYESVIPFVSVESLYFGRQSIPCM